MRAVGVWWVVEATRDLDEPFEHLGVGLELLDVAFLLFGRFRVDLGSIGPRPLGECGEGAAAEDQVVGAFVGPGKRDREWYHKCKYHWEIRECCNGVNLWNDKCLKIDH